MKDIKWELDPRIIDEARKVRGEFKDNIPFLKDWYFGIYNRKLFIYNSEKDINIACFKCATSEMPKEIIKLIEFGSPDRASLYQLNELALATWVNHKWKVTNENIVETFLENKRILSQ